MKDDREYRFVTQPSDLIYFKSSEDCDAYLKQRKEEEKKVFAIFDELDKDPKFIEKHVHDKKYSDKFYQDLFKELAS